MAARRPLILLAFLGALLLSSACTKRIVERVAVTEDGKHAIVELRTSLRRATRVGIYYCESGARLKAATVICQSEYHIFWDLGSEDFLYYCSSETGHGSVVVENLKTGFKKAHAVDPDSIVVSIQALKRQRGALINTVGKLKKMYLLLDDKAFPLIPDGIPWTKQGTGDLMLPVTHVYERVTTGTHVFYNHLEELSGGKNWLCKLEKVTITSLYPLETEVQVALDLGKLIPKALSINCDNIICVSISPDSKRLCLYLGKMRQTIELAPELANMALGFSNEQVFFNKKHKGTWQVWVYNAPGPPQRLTDGGADCKLVGLDQSRKRVLYQQRGTEIWSMNADGSDNKLILR